MDRSQTSLNRGKNLAFVPFRIRELPSEIAVPGRGYAGKTKKKAVSKSQRAGLVFPVGRVLRHLKDGRYIGRHSQRVGASAAVYLAAVAEYLAAEVLDSAGETCQRREKTRITPRDLQLAIATDEDLAKVFEGVTISSGGVVPGVHPFLLRHKKGAATGKREAAKKA